MSEPFGVFNDDPSRRGAWIQTFTGGKFWPLDPRPEDFQIADIAHALSNVCRYGGHTKRFYSVAEHAVIVSLYVPRQWRREALLHDLSEAYTGDMVRPLKYQPEMAEFRKAENRIESVARGHFKLSTDPACWSAVKEIDDRIIVDEVGELMAAPPMYWTRHPDVKSLGAVIMGAPPAIAEDWFLDEFAALFPEFPQPVRPRFEP